MSNRFHNKFHRENHHSKRTIANNSVVDASYDPIASYGAPFQGEFYTDGEIVTNSYVKAVSGGFGNNIEVGTNVYVGNNAVVVNDFEVGHDATINNDLAVANDAVIGNNFSVSNSETIGNNLNVGNNVSVANNLAVGKNLTVVGNLSVLGDTSTIETFTTVTSAFSITNTGTQTALTVNQTGAQDVAYFKDDGNMVLSVNNGGKIGVNTSVPNKELTVIGSISATQDVYVNNDVYVKNDVYIDNNVYADKIILTNAAVNTFVTPVTASGDFLILNINGTNRAIRLWDF